MQPGYDHSYYFIATFMAEHIAWHAARLAWDARAGSTGSPGNINRPLDQSV